MMLSRCSYLAAPSETDPGIPSDHQMIEDLDAEQSASLDQPAGDPLVVPGRFRVTRRVVVREDHRCGVPQERIPEYAMRGHEGVVDRADAHRGRLQDAVLGVEKHDEAVLSVSTTDERHDVLGDLLGIP